MPELPPENAKPATYEFVTSGPLAVARFLIGAFSTVRARDPPREGKMSHLRLVTIPASHFCEKARWILDHLEASDDNPYYYTEDAHPPPFHAYETLRVSNGEASITPMLAYQENGNEQVVYDSNTILKRFLPALYPQEIEARIDEANADLGKRLGAALRCFGYYHLLTNVQDCHSFVVRMCADPKKVAHIESTVFDKFLENGLAKGIMKSLSVTPETNEASTDALRQVFQEYSQKLEDSGGEYLMDTPTKSYGFTAVDLTFAALSYLLLRPKEMSHWLGNEEDLPDALNSMTKELRATKAGQHVLRVYEKHRLPNGEKIVTMKYADRNQSAWDGLMAWWNGTN